jgi:choline dehydrogenase
VSGDPKGQPAIDYKFLSKDADLKRMRQSVRTMQVLASQAAFRNMLGELINPRAEDVRDDAALDAWLLREVTTCQHICGTCKMGMPSDKMAVVDQFGSVFGIDGLRVGTACAWAMPRSCGMASGPIRMRLPWS